MKINASIALNTYTPYIINIIFLIWLILDQACFRSLGQKFEKKNRLVFGTNENEKICFWNKLTFRKPLESNCFQFHLIFIKRKFWSLLDPRMKPLLDSMMVSISNNCPNICSYVSYDTNYNKWSEWSAHRMFSRKTNSGFPWICMDLLRHTQTWLNLFRLEEILSFI